MKLTKNKNWKNSRIISQRLVTLPTKCFLLKVSQEIYCWQCYSIQCDQMVEYKVAQLTQMLQENVETTVFTLKVMLLKKPKQF